MHSTVVYIGCSLVLVFFINPIGASELTRGVSSSNLGTNPSTTPFFERGLHLNSSRWLYRTPPTLVGRLQLLVTLVIGDFGDFGVSFVATVAGRYTRRGDPRLSVQGEPLIVLTRVP